jgi:hypothetical protein
MWSRKGNAVRTPAVVKDVTFNNRFSDKKQENKVNPKSKHNWLQRKRTRVAPQLSQTGPAPNCRVASRPTWGKHTHGEDGGFMPHLYQYYGSQNGNTRIHAHTHTTRVANKRHPPHQGGKILSRLKIRSEKKIKSCTVDRWINRELETCADITPVGCHWLPMPGGMDVTSGFKSASLLEHSNEQHTNLNLT